ncbi:MAG: hypothetical protein FJX67_12445 [Alphaproteobacteria bacterium]|nr:hypothetical protein [Alphaproteobacteria bacterium]
MPIRAFAALVALTGLTGLAGLIAGPGSARADAVADFYKGKDITIVVAFDAGGGYGLYARTLAQFWGKHIPGKPNVITQFMPGAGGTRATNHVFAAAPKDGLFVAMPSNTYALSQALGDNAVRYEAQSFRALGRIDNMNSAIMVWHTAPATNLKDMETKETIFGGSGKAAQDYMNPSLMRNLLGLKYRVVLGYPGSKEINIAIERGEIHAMANSWASVKSVYTHNLAEKKIIPVAMVALQRTADLPNVPTLMELAKTPESRAIMELMASSTAVGRAFIAPPGVPADRVAALRRAFDATMKDPEFIAEAEKRKMDLDTMTGIELQKIVEKTVATPPDIIAKFKAAIE